jgi:membrane carboxypeptidase/penicillin-binding protein
VSLTTVLAKSSNVGSARVALTMEPKAIWDVLTRLGIGRLTDSAFPGESAGNLAEPKHWRTVGQATLSYGYGVSVTTLQLARAYAAIAAGGVIRPVSMLALDEAPPGERAISAQAAADLTLMLQAVVSPEGTGYRASVRNFHVAGKTGRERSHEVLVLGQGGRRACACDDLIADRGVTRDVCANYVDRRRTFGPIRAIRVRDASRPQRLTQDVFAKLSTGGQHGPGRGSSW